MELREISIGRSTDSDIFLDSRCKFASNHHGLIYYDGNQLMYKDISRNGTLINNISVHGRAVPIKEGDTISLAGIYQISWSQINAFFPRVSPPPRDDMGGGLMGQTSDPPENELHLSRWSWGAFGLYPIWGFFNGCWWAFIVSMFLGWLFPIPNILFGVYGTRLAWNSRTWSSVSAFNSTQSSWGIWGIIVSILNVIVDILYIAFFLSILK